MLSLALSLVSATAAAQVPDGPGSFPAGRGPVDESPHLELRIEDVRAGSGDADPVPVLRVLRSRQPMVRACLVHAGDAVPREAAITLRFEVGADGRVSEAVAHEDGRAIEGPLRECLVVRYIAHLVFPADAASEFTAVVRYEFPDRPEDATLARTEIEAARSEARAARSHARCLSREGRRVEAAAARLEAARGRAVARAREQLRLARGELAGCSALLGLLRDTGTPSVGTGMPLVGGVLR